VVGFVGGGALDGPVIGSRILRLVYILGSSGIRWGFFIGWFAGRGEKTQKLLGWEL
jgi:hypothetical protein